MFKMHEFEVAAELFFVLLETSLSHKISFYLDKLETLTQL